MADILDDASGGNAYTGCITYTLTRNTMPDFDDLYGGEVAKIDWARFVALFHEIKEKLLSLRLETYEQAVEEHNFRLSAEREYQYSDQNIIRYRASDDHDLLRDYHAVALSRIEIVENLISEGGPGVELLYHWGVLTSCYGYLLNSTLAWSTDLFGDVNRKKSSETLRYSPQLKWYVHWRNFHVNENGLSVRESNELIRSLIFNLINGDKKPPRGFDKHWFGACLRGYTKRKKVSKYNGAFSHDIRKISSNSERFQKLCELSPSEKPCIPPLDPNLYKEKPSP